MQSRTPSRAQLSQQVIDSCLAMNARGINQGSAGNISVRFKDGFLITPSGMAYDRLQPEHIVLVDLDGSSQDNLNPSSEWRMHRDIYANRAEAGAVLHAHSTFATALSCLRNDIPAFHYMIAVAGGHSIRCADYALFGTQALSDHMLVALDGRRACLLGTHGMICFHDNLDKALWLGVEVETLARQYWHACQAGDPVILSPAQMDEVLLQFQGYGKQPTQAQ
ncbi:MAG TPA: class II aldolase/adducin family protein [Gammaproteobacteria bacterium]|nr:class II aldolase/adducin family protein [Gammaproteobacteria bacterium]